MLSRSQGYRFKYIIVGDSGVGKSCLLTQFTQHKFECMHDLTIGVEFGTYETSHNNEKIILQIWDTAGQEAFKSITRSYYRGAVCALVVFNVTDKPSFENVQDWIYGVRDNSASITKIILIGNKCDLPDRQVSKQEAEEFAKQHKIVYIETSAKTSENVQEAFLNTIPALYKLAKEGKITTPIRASPTGSHLVVVNNETQNAVNNESGYCAC
jgi:Ras-related protein Rab-2A